MHLEISLNRYVGALRLEGHAYDAIAFALAESAVDALIAAGFRNGALDSGMAMVIGAMRERAAELRAMRAPPSPRLVKLDGGGKESERDPTTCRFAGLLSEPRQNRSSKRSVPPPFVGEPA